MLEVNLKMKVDAILVGIHHHLIHHLLLLEIMRAQLRFFNSMIILENGVQLIYVEEMIDIQMLFMIFVGLQILEDLIT